MKIHITYIIREVYMKVKYLSLLFILSSSVTTAFSQVNDSLLKYLDIAVRNNPSVLQRFAGYRAALEKVPQAGSLQDPQLDIGIFLSPMEYVSGNQVADIKLMQMFPWFGVLRNAKDEMSQMANASYEQFRDAKLQVSFDLQKAWYDLYRIRKEIGISQKNIEILAIIERLALVQYRTPASAKESSSAMPQGNVQQGSSAQPAGGMQGMTGNQAGNAAGNNITSSSSAPMNGSSMESSGGSARLTDIYRIKIETGDLRNSIALLKSREQSATALFNSYLDRPASFPVFTPDTLAADTIRISYEAANDTIAAKNPMLRMTEFEKKAYESRKKMVTAMGYPMVGVGVNYSLMSMNKNGMADESMNGKDMIMPMVSVTLPIYRKKFRAMKKEADFHAEEAGFSYRSIMNSLETEYFQAVELYNDAKRRLILYDEQQTLASNSLELMLKSFSVSSSDLTGVLRIRQQVLDYELNRLRADADLNTASAWIKKIMADTAF